MQTPVIQTTNLNFSFKNGFKTLDNINLLVPRVVSMVFSGQTEPVKQQHCDCFLAC